MADRAGLPVIVVDAALEEEAAVGSEEEGVRRDEGAVGPRDVLAPIAKVGKGVALVLGARLHPLEPVVGVGVGIVRVDEHEGDAAGTEAPAEVDQAALPRLDVRAVVAPEDDEQELLGVGVVEPVLLPVDPGQREVGSRVAGTEPEVRELGHAVVRGREGFTAAGGRLYDPGGCAGVERRFDGRVAAATDVERDEALLRRGRPAVRVAILADRALSLGVAQATDAPAALRAAALGLPVVRRSTGGTGVLHLPGDLAWSVVLPREDPRVGRGFVRAYGRFGEGAVRLLVERGVESSWVPAPGLSPEACLLGDRGEVLAAGPRVVGGAAQHLTARAILHHGVIGVLAEPDLESELFDVPASLLRSRRAGLDGLGVTLSSEWLAARLLDHLARSLGRPAEDSAGAGTTG